LEFSDSRHVLEQPPLFDARNFECECRGNVDEFASKGDVAQEPQDAEINKSWWQKLFGGSGS